MTTKKSRKKLYFFLFVIVLLLAGLVSFSIPGEFLTDEDFSLPSPALLRLNDYCNKYPSWSNEIKDCNDGTWKTHNLPSNNYAPARYVGVDNGKLTMSASGRNDYQPAEAVYLKDYKGRNIIVNDILFSYDTGGVQQGGGASFVINLNDKTAYSKSIGEATGGIDDILFEAKADDFDINLYHILINGKEVNQVMNDKETLTIGFRLSASGDTSGASVSIDNIRSEPIYSCEISDDEIIFTDRFYSGSKFTLDSSKVGGDVVALSHKPLKFCRTGTPVVRRNLDLGVRTEFFDRTFTNLVNGEIIIVPADEFMEVSYVIDYVPGSPSSNCPADSYSLNGVCKPVITAKPDIVELDNQKETIFVGTNELLFKDNVKIADKELTSSKPTYLCSDDDSVQSSCFQTIVSYDGQEITLIGGEEKSLDDYFLIRYYPVAQFKDGLVQTYENNFLLSQNKDIVSLDYSGDLEQEYFVIYNEDREMCFEVNNNLGTFDNSGFIIKRTGGLLTGEESYYDYVSFDGGNNVYCTKVNSKTFGTESYKVNLFYKIGDKLFTDDEVLPRQFEVVNDVPADVSVTIKQKLSLFERIITFLKNLFGG